MAKEQKGMKQTPDNATPEEAHDNHNAGENASPAAPVFEVSDVISPSEPTEGATMPEPSMPPEKRGRGRPAGSGGKSKPKKVTENEGLASAHIIVKAMDGLGAAVSGGEFAPDPKMRGATIEAWKEYLAQNGYEVPAWVQVAFISTVYLTPAFQTPKGKGVISGTFAKIKAWYIKRKG